MRKPTISSHASYAYHSILHGRAFEYNAPDYKNDLFNLHFLKFAKVLYHISPVLNDHPAMESVKNGSGILTIS